MFEQSQIQEYKEVSFYFPLTVMLHHLEPGVHRHHHGNTSNTSADPQFPLSGARDQDKSEAERLLDPFSEQLPFFPVCSPTLLPLPPPPLPSHDNSISAAMRPGGAEAFLTPSEAPRVLLSSDLQLSPNHLLEAGGTTAEGGDAERWFAPDAELLTPTAAHFCPN